MSSHRDLFDRQRKTFLSDFTKSLGWRLDQLGRLERMLGENQQAFDEALGTDFKTAWFERALEIGGTLGVIADAKAQLAKWMEPEPAPLSPRLEQNGVRAVVRREPYGNCLLIAPFNAPIALSLAGYVFSNAQATVDRFVEGLSFGGGGVNQTMLQCVLTEYLPFGGVGASGLGRYYGKYGFDSLSYMKSVVISPPEVRIDPLLPPYVREDLAALNDWLAPAKPGTAQHAKTA